MMHGLRAALGMIVLGWLVLAAGLVAEATRPSPEAALRGYLAALEEQRSEAALAMLPPGETERWRDFVQFQQFNRYQVISIAVRSPSLLDSLIHGRPWRATQATLVADVLEPSGIRWRGSTVVPVALIEEQWVLLRPPFAPE